MSSIAIAGLLMTITAPLPVFAEMHHRPVAIPIVEGVPVDVDDDGSIDFVGFDQYLMEISLHVKGLDGTRGSAGVLFLDSDAWLNEWPVPYGTYVPVPSWGGGTSKPGDHPELSMPYLATYAHSGREGFEPWSLERGEYYAAVTFVRDGASHGGWLRIQKGPLEVEPPIIVEIGWNSKPEPLVVVGWQDCNDNETNDVFELKAGEIVDCDGDGLLDECQIDMEPSLDRNNDGILDRCQPARPDFDGDGIVGSADLAVLLAAWDGGGVADLDGDGVVGPVDLAILIGAWGG